MFARRAESVASTPRRGRVEAAEGSRTWIIAAATATGIPQVVDSDKPKCVRPETTTLDRPSFLSIVRIFYSEDAHLSTLRHLHDGADLEALLNPDTAPPEDATPPDGDEASALLG